MTASQQVPMTNENSIDKYVTRLAQQELFSACLFVIDDEEIVTDIVAMHLGCAGFTNVHCFNDPIDAIETLQHVQCQVVLTDVNMPGLGGCYLTQLAKQMEHLRNVPIIGVTADVTQTTREKLLASGAYEVLNKPIDREQLVDCIQRALCN